MTALSLACREEHSPGWAERVILITCDTLRADRLGTYGYARDVSPQVDAFARGNFVFERAYATAPLTGPAMSALMTGRFPDELGVSANNRMLLAPEATTLAEIVRENGIATAAVVSNWVLRKRDGVGNAGIHQGFEHFDDELESAELNRSEVYERVAKDTTDAALSWIAARPDDRFFLWVHYQDPHGPYTPPDSYVATLDRPLSGEPLLEVGTNNTGLGALPAYQVLGDERHPETYRIRYDAEIRFFDREVGRLLDGIGAYGLEHDALIIFTSDHGESLGEHGYYFSHGQSLFRDLVQVPLVIRYPSGAPRPRVEFEGGSQRVPWVTHHLDIWPTVLEAFGIMPPPSRGQSLFSGQLDGGRIAVHHLRVEGMPTRWLGITSERHRLLKHAKGELLFDIGGDPFETVNVARTEAERLRELEAQYQHMLEVLPPLGLKGILAPLDEDSAAQLEKLGYAGDD